MNIDALLTPQDWDDLPEDPDEALAYVIRIAQRAANEEFDRQRSFLNQSEDYTALHDAQFGYLSSIIGVAKALGVPAFEHYSLPDPTRFNSDHFRRFQADVNQFTAQVAARRALKSRNLSVALHPKVKDSIRGYVHHLKEAIDNSTLEQAKREALLAKLRAFEEELDGGKRINILNVATTYPSKLNRNAGDEPASFKRIGGEVRPP